MHKKSLWIGVFLLLLALLSVLPAAAQGGSGNLTLSCDGNTVREAWVIDGPTLGGFTGHISDGSGYVLDLTTFVNSALTPFSNTTVTLYLYDASFTFLLDAETITCGTPPTVTPPGDCPYVRDGRINDCNLDKIAIYPVQDGNGYGLEVWLVDGLDFELRELVISAQELAAIPEFPAENVLIKDALNGLIKVFKLTTSEYQVDYGPDADGKVFSFFFKHFQPGAYTMEVH